MRTLYVRPAEGAVVGSRCAVVTVSPLLRELVLRTVAIGMLDERIPAHVAMAHLILEEIRERPTKSLDLPMPTSEAARSVADRLLERHPPAGLGDLSRGAGLSPRTLERRFLEETGMTLGRWRRQARLLEALRQLALGQAVKTVAEGAGYSSPSAFVASFRAVFGTTPARYFAPLRAEGDAAPFLGEPATVVRSSPPSPG
jgi:AraC-like DNA-binding protein